MAFSLDRTRSYVRIDEPNLISIHRSTCPIVPAADYSQGHLCDAFICAAREYNLFRVYIGLYDSQLKSNLVFVADPVGFDNKKTAILIKEAETFLTSIGFSMEPVNMEFSSATREVIMRDIKVMREPSLAVRLDAAMLAIEGLTADKNELIQKESRTHKAFKAEVDKLRQQLVLANTATFEATGKPVLDEESAVALMMERDSLRAELAVIREEIKAIRSEHSHAQVIKNKSQLDRHSFDTLLKAAKEESRVLREEACIAREQAEAAKHEAYDARQEIQALQDAVNAFEEEAQADKNTAQTVYSGEIASLEQEIDRLHREHDTIMAVQSNEINALRAALAITDESLSFERTKNESALQEMDALERNATVELKKLKKKVDSLSDEKHVLESMAAEMKMKAKGEIERLQQINQSQRRAAIKKVKALKEEMRQLSEARAVMTSPLAASLSTVDARKPSDSGCELETLPLIADSARSSAAFSDPFGCSHITEYVSFESDSALDGIPYSMLDDVVEVHRSFNKIQTAPFGKQVQSCDGFVCLVKDIRRGMLVYVVWLMKETGVVLVCRPDHIPEKEGNVSNLVREGIGYFERVGFIMDELILMSDPEQRQHQIDALPFFHKIAMECAA